MYGKCTFLLSGELHVYLMNEKSTLLLSGVFCGYPVYHWKTTLLLSNVFCGYPVYGKSTLLLSGIFSGYPVYGKRTLLLNGVLCGYPIGKLNRTFMKHNISR